MVLLLYNLILTLFFIFLYIYFLFFNSLHCPLSGPDLNYISLLIIPCIIYHVTNKETLNLEPCILLHMLQLDCVVCKTSALHKHQSAIGALLFRHPEFIDYLICAN